jgi:hypothetical protein
MRLWARVIASVLAPGGELYCADAHPGFYVLEEFAGKLLPTYDYWTPPDRPLEFNNATTYTGDPTVMTHQSTREWIHPLSDTRWVVAASRRPSPHSRVVFDASEKRGVRLLHCQMF